jgi:hypothetical protein
VFALEFEDTYRILLVRFSSVLMPENITQIDQGVTRAIAWGCPLHGLLLGFFSVQAVGVPQTFIALSQRLPFLSPDWERVFVVPNGELRWLAQTYAVLQRALWHQGAARRAVDVRCL